MESPELPYQQNRRAWDQLAAHQDRLCRPARDVDFENPLRTVDAIGWLGDSIHGQRVLCLAAGGGRQGPIYAAAGAVVTVVDLSPAMLELDRQVAHERGLSLRTVEASMDNLSALGDGAFDIVIHPVSTCYVPRLAPVYAEIARVIVANGIYISQHKQPVSLQSGLDPNSEGYVIEHNYFRQTALPPSPRPNLIRENGTLEYIHRWEELLGEMCCAGFAIEGLTEPLHAKPDAEIGSFGHRSQFIAPYVRLKARRLGAAQAPKILL